MTHLEFLISEYRNAPELFKAGRYWQEYEEKIINQIKSVDLNQLRSGKYPVFATFGFNEAVYHYRHDSSVLSLAYKKFVRKFLLRGGWALPYNLKLHDIREMAFRHAELLGELTGSRSIRELGVSLFGSPQDVFKMKDQSYTMRFLSFYVRYCFVNRYVRFQGNEIVVELGSGSGHQVEILKKLYPKMTILCFDLPSQLFLCEQYLVNALPERTIVSSRDTLKMTSLSGLEKGKVYMFGNWMFPLLENFSFDMFWNAASFGEMEPNIVRNYLRYIDNGCGWVYLLQAAKGKESSESKGVKQPINFDFYSEVLGGKFTKIVEEPGYEAHRRLSQSGGYRQAIWKSNK